MLADGEVPVPRANGESDVSGEDDNPSREYHRPPEKLFPHGYSRHYYDDAMVAQGLIWAEALADLELLAQIARHNEMFYPSGWARYRLARPGSLHLVPTQARFGGLARCGGQ